MKNILTNLNKELYLKSQRGSGFFMDNLAQSRLEVTNRYFADNRNVPFYLEEDMPKGTYKRMTITPLFREAQRKRMLGKHRSKATKKKISETRRLRHNNNWNGGRYKDEYGYIQVLSNRHPSVVGRYIREHRLVMEKHLDRYLTPLEIVHHIDGNKQNNRIENLKLFKDNSEHSLHYWSQFKKERK